MNIIEEQVMTGVTEYEEGMDVELIYYKNRPVILAKNEAGHCCTRVDLLDLLNWVEKEMRGTQKS